MQKALIVGAGGFCGRHLAERLKAQGRHRVYGIDVSKSNPKNTVLDDYQCVDITDEIQLNEYIQCTCPDVIFHLAGIVRGQPAQIYLVNLLGGINLLEAVRQFAPDARLLIVGSAAEYGHVVPDDLPVKEDYPCKPSGPYGLSKHALTSAAIDYSLRYGLRIAVARPFNIVGAGVPETMVVGAILGRLRSALKSGQESIVRIGNLDTERDFLSVDDAVTAFLKIVEGAHMGEIFNVCSGNAVLIKWVADYLLSLSGREARLVIDDSLVRSSDVSTIYGSCEKAKQAFGFNPQVSLQDALKQAWVYCMGDAG
jgi:GDP-4-dehydro-6-deoxy-D-mannose reductase